MYIRLPCVYIINMINIRNAAVEQLARTLAGLERVGITEAIQRALEDRATRLSSAQSPTDRDRAALARIRDKAARLVIRDSRSEDEILGYRPSGAFE